MLTPEERGDAEDFLAAIRRRTNPFREDSEPSPIKLHPSPTVKGLRAMLAEAKAFLGQVRSQKRIEREHCRFKAIYA